MAAEIYAVSTDRAGMIRGLENLPLQARKIINVVGFKQDLGGNAPPWQNALPRHVLKAVDVADRRLQRGSPDPPILSQAVFGNEILRVFNHIHFYQIARALQQASTFIA